MALIDSCFLMSFVETNNIILNTSVVWSNIYAFMGMDWNFIGRVPYFE